MTESILPAFYSGKTVLVTGGTGFIGSSVIQSLRESGAIIISVSRKKQEDQSRQSSVTRVRGDYSVSFWKQILPRVDVIFHFAAQTSSAYANLHPTRDFQSNILPVVSLVEACQATGKRPIVVFSGSVTQTGMTRSVPVNEQRPDSPTTIYDMSKLVSEQYVRYYAKAMGGHGVTLRLANVYGPGPTSSSADRGILNLMVRKALSGQDLTVYGSGAYTRDYVYISDVVSAFLAAAASLSKTNGKYYLVGSGTGHTVAEMIKMVSKSVLELTGKKSKLISVREPEDLPEIEHRHFIADTAGLSGDTGWHAKVTLKEGLRKTIEFYLKQV